MRYQPRCSKNLVVTVTTVNLTEPHREKMTYPYPILFSSSGFWWGRNLRELWIGWDSGKIGLCGSCKTSLDQKPKRKKTAENHFFVTHIYLQETRQFAK